MLLCFSCLKLYVLVLGFCEADTPQFSTGKSDFPHCIQCYMFVICRAGRIPPTHLSSSVARLRVSTWSPADDVAMDTSYSFPCDTSGQAQNAGKT